MLSRRILTPYGYIWSETVFTVLVLSFSRKRRRDSTRIIYEILLASKNGVSKTRAVYASNLNFRLIEDYLAFLLKMKYLERTPNGSSHDELRLTDKGARLLGLLDQLAIREGEKALDFAKAANDESKVAMAQLAIGEASVFLGRKDEPLRHFSGALKYYEECGNRAGQANAARLIAQVFLNHNDFPRVLDYANRALALVLEAGD